MAPRSRRARAALTGLRIATGVVVLAVGAATVTAAALIPLPTVDNGVASVTVTPAASDQTRACAGSLVRLSDQDATQVTVVGQPRVVAGVLPSGTALQSDALGSPDASATDSEKPTSLVAPGASGITLAGSQSQQPTDADLIGLATSACAEVSSSSWLVGGSTTTGRTSFVVLTNPSEVASTVTLAIFSEVGAVASTGASNIVVAPKSQSVVSLAGLAPNATSPVVHVTSTGGNVAATLQSSVVRSLDPGGVDVAGPTDAPGLSHTIAGVQIVSTSAIAERAADPASSDLPAALRVYVPGADSASVSVTLKSETLGVADTDVTFTATGGLVTDFPFPSLTDDTYSVSVVADKPVVVGARSAVVSGGVDFAWYQASASIDQEFAVATATGPNPRLQLANPTSADAAVTVTPLNGGAAVTLTVGGESAAGVPLAENTVYTVETTAPLVASVGYLGDGLISAFSLQPPSPLASPLTVYPSR